MTPRAAVARDREWHRRCSYGVTDGKHPFALSTWLLEAGDEVLQHVVGDGQRIGASLSVPAGQAPARYGRLGLEVEKLPAAAVGFDERLVAVAVRSLPEPRRRARPTDSARLARRGGGRALEPPRRNSADSRRLDSRRHSGSGERAPARRSRGARNPSLRGASRTPSCLIPSARRGGTRPVAQRTHRTFEDVRLASGYRTQLATFPSMPDCATSGKPSRGPCGRGRSPRLDGRIRSTVRRTSETAQDDENRLAKRFSRAQWRRWESNPRPRSRRGQRLRA